MSGTHCYTAQLIWTGNTGTGTSGYTAYSRNHTIHFSGKPELRCSSDPVFRGDSSCYNPEEMLLASLSGCHMLWFLHLCADAGICVVAYSDDPVGVLTLTAKNGGHFSEVTLHPKVTITDASRIAETNALHATAHTHCFIANSMNFPVRHEPACTVMAQNK